MRAERIERDEVRENRITMEAVVDAYCPEERALGWYYYLEEKITFPFLAVCRERKRTSPIGKGEVYSIIGMADVEECYGEMFVVIDYAEDELLVSLSQILPDEEEVEEETWEAVTDWHYWQERGYLF